MKRIVNFAMSVTAFAVLGLVMAPSARADGPHCSNATLKGSYSATITGFVGTTAPFTPFAELDLVTSTGDGTFSGTGTNSVGGVVTTGITITATYTINSDCSGSAVLSTGVTQNFNIKEDGSEVTFISTNAGATITGEAKRLSDHDNGH